MLKLDNLFMKTDGLSDMPQKRNKHNTKNLQTHKRC